MTHAIQRPDAPRNRKPLHELSMRSLRRYECGWCGQRLDRLKRNPHACGSIWDRDGCPWHERLNQETER